MSESNDLIENGRGVEQTVKFATFMSQKLNGNRNKPDWHTQSVAELRAHFLEEVQEFLAELDREEVSPLDLTLEAADVACLAMMLCDKHGMMKLY